MSRRLQADNESLDLSKQDSIYCRKGKSLYETINPSKKGNILQNGMEKWCSVMIYSKRNHPTAHQLFKWKIDPIRRQIEYGGRCKPTMLEWTRKGEKLSWQAITALSVMKLLSSARSGTKDIEIGFVTAQLLFCIQPNLAQDHLIHLYWSCWNVTCVTIAETHASLLI